MLKKIFFANIANFLSPVFAALCCQEPQGMHAIRAAKFIRPFVTITMSFALQIPPRVLLVRSAQ